MTPLQFCAVGIIAVALAVIIPDRVVQMVLVLAAVLCAVLALIK